MSVSCGKRANRKLLASEDFCLLIFETGDGATLWSRHLDRTMHGGRSVPVLFGTIWEEVGGVKVVLDSFELASLSEYLAQQHEIRRSIESASVEDSKLWGLGSFSGPKIWTRIRGKAKGVTS